MKFARQYFGSASEFRAQWLPEIEARNNAARAAETKIAKAGVRELLTHLRDQGPQLDVALNDSKSLATEIREAKRAKNADHIARLPKAAQRPAQANRSFQTANPSQDWWHAVQPGYQYKRQPKTKRCITIRSGTVLQPGHFFG